MPTAPAVGYIPQRPGSTTADEAGASQQNKVVSDTASYAKEQPIRMAQQPQDDQISNLRGGQRGGGTGECCLYCCGIVVLIKCLDSFCG